MRNILFFSGLEKRSGQSLGRRLAHSSSESEEWLIVDSNIKISSSRNLKKWSETSNDWQDRGLGSFELIDNSDEIRILINHPSNGPMCAGIFSAIWELSSGNRFRFRWNQNTSESLMLSLSEDNIFLAPCVLDEVTNRPKVGLIAINEKPKTDVGIFRDIRGCVPNCMPELNLCPIIFFQYFLSIIY